MMIHVPRLLCILCISVSRVDCVAYKHYVQAGKPSSDTTAVTIVRRDVQLIKSTTQNKPGDISQFPSAVVIHGHRQKGCIRHGLIRSYVYRLRMTIMSTADVNFYS